MKIRVYYEDTDAGGIVFHSNYINFCERARSECFFANGSTPMFDGGEFVVASLEAKFIMSAKLGDLLDVTTEVLEIKNSSIQLSQKVYKDNIILFSMNIKLAYMKENKIGRMTLDTKEYIGKIFNGSVL